MEESILDNGLGIGYQHSKETIVKINLILDTVNKSISILKLGWRVLLGMAGLPIIYLLINHQWGQLQLLPNTTLTDVLTDIDFFYFDIKNILEYFFIEIHFKELFIACVFSCCFYLVTTFYIRYKAILAFTVAILYSLLLFFWSFSITNLVDGLFFKTFWIATLIYATFHSYKLNKELNNLASLNFSINKKKIYKELNKINKY